MYMVIGYYVNSGCGHVLLRVETLEEANEWTERNTPIEDFDSIIVTKVLSINGDTRF